jgi:hypothetical protein
MAASPEESPLPSFYRFPLQPAATPLQRSRGT